MATLPKVDVVFVGFGMVCGIIASELSKRATNLKMVGLERGPFRTTNPDFLMDHFDEFRYAVQGQLFQDLSRETWTFRNNLQGGALPVRQYGAWLRTGADTCWWKPASLAYLNQEHIDLFCRYFERFSGVRVALSAASFDVSKGVSGATTPPAREISGY